MGPTSAACRVLLPGLIRQDQKLTKSVGIGDFCIRKRVLWLGVDALNFGIWTLMVRASGFRALRTRVIRTWSFRDLRGPNNPNRSPIANSPKDCERGDITAEVARGAS